MPDNVERIGDADRAGHEPSPASGLGNPVTIPCAAKLRENADNLKSYVDSMIAALREDEFWGRGGIEQRVRANFELGLRIAASVVGATKDLAEYVEAIATEARRAETAKTGSVHDGAAIAQTQSEN